MDDFTLVCGVDKKHLDQLKLTYPTWVKHKPSLLKRPMLIFFDRSQVKAPQIDIKHPRLQLVPWPPPGVKYEGGDDKWTNPQRYKMLAGFIHVAAGHVQTPYMLKIDTDVVATGRGNWIDRSWFKSPLNSIISHRWSYTKPANQMMELDNWAEIYKFCLPPFDKPPLNLRPNEGSDRLSHKRIISWCSFFEMKFIKFCSCMAERTVGRGQLPVPSQDGYLFYMAQRMGLNVIRQNFKERGWEQWTTMTNVKNAVKRALA